MRTPHASQIPVARIPVSLPSGETPAIAPASPTMIAKTTFGMCPSYSIPLAMKYPKMGKELRHG